MKMLYETGNRTIGFTKDRAFFLPDYSLSRKEYSKPKLTKYSNNTINYLDKLSAEDILNIKSNQRIKMLNLISNIVYFEGEIYEKSSKMLEEICQDKTLQEKIYSIIEKEKEKRRVFRVEIK